MQAMTGVLWGFLAVFLSRCDAHIFRVNTCPNVKVMKDFDMDKFSGVWYVQQRFHPVCTCIKLNITKDSEGTYNIEEVGRPFGIYLGFDPFKRKPKQMKFLSDETESIFRIQSRFGPLEPATFGIVSTDYEQYALMWGCDPLLFGSVQDVNVLTRDPQVDDDLIKTAKSKMEGFDVDLSNLDKVDQSKCSAEVNNDNGSSKYNNMIIEK